MSRRNAFIGLLVLAVLASLLVWQLRWTTPATRTNPVLVVGDQKGGAQALLKAAGELDNAPYEIRWALFPAASPLLEALDAGAIDMGGVGGAPQAQGGRAEWAVHNRLERGNPVRTYTGPGFSPRSVS